MGKLVIHQDAVTEESAASLVKLCPFGAISYEKGRVEISSACKMCKLCVRKGGGLVTFEEEAVAAPTLDKSLWRGVCVYADLSGGALHPVTAELCGKARELAAVINHPVYALVIGNKTAAAAKELLSLGVDKVFVYDHPAFEDFRVEPYTAAFYDFIEKEKPSSILVGATLLGRQLAPRVAARCKTGLTADCTVLEMKENTDLVQIRPAFGGNIMAQIVTQNTRPQFCTVRYKVFSAPAPVENPTGEVVQMAATDAMLASAITVLSRSPLPKTEDIADADVIVAVGRGAQSETLRAEAAELAELLGGKLACSRPMVESNLFDAKKQIGLSGRTVKPKLIICLGISGAVQFAAGMKNADTIVAVNTDPAAPIFDIAHVCVVGDVNEILPRLIGGVAARKSN